MEEDIKILEEMKFWEGCETTIDEKWCKAFENLLTRYKQLEEDNKELKKYYATRKEVEDLKETISCLHESADNFIPKSKVKEKIEEYRKKRNELSNGHFWDNPYNINQDTVLFIAIETLQELLREE